MTERKTQPKEHKQAEQIPTCRRKEGRQNETTERENGTWRVQVKEHEREGDKEREREKERLDLCGRENFCIARFQTQREKLQVIRESNIGISRPRFTVRSSSGFEYHGPAFPSPRKVKPSEIT